MTTPAKNTTATGPTKPKRARKATAKSKTPPPDAPAKPKTKTLALPALTVVSQGTQATTTVVSSGSDSFARPVMVPPTSPMAVMNNLLARDQLDPQEPLEPASPTIIGLQNTVNALTNATSIEPYREHIQQVATNQPEKNDVLFGYFNQLDGEYLADLYITRHEAMRHVKRAIRRGDVSSHEAIVVWQHADNRIPAVKKELKENSKPVDTATVVEKIDYHRQQTEHIVMKRWEGTTPQGRELIRKKLYKLKKEIKIQQGILPEGFEPPEVPDDMAAEEAGTPPQTAPTPA